MFREELESKVLKDVQGLKLSQGCYVVDVFNDEVAVVIEILEDDEKVRIGYVGNENFLRGQILEANCSEVEIIENKQYFKIKSNSTKKTNELVIDHKFYNLDVACLDEDGEEVENPDYDSLNVNDMDELHVTFDNGKSIRIGGLREYTFIAKKLMCSAKEVVEGLYQSELDAINDYFNKCNCDFYLSSEFKIVLKVQN